MWRRKCFSSSGRRSPVIFWCCLYPKHLLMHRRHSCIKDSGPGERSREEVTHMAKTINLKQQLCNPPPATHLSPGFRAQQWKVQPASAKGHLPTSPCLVTLSLLNWHQEYQSFPFRLHKCLYCLRRDDWCYFKSPFPSLTPPVRSKFSVHCFSEAYIIIVMNTKQKTLYSSLFKPSMLTSPM